MTKRVKWVFRTDKNQLGWASFGRQDNHFHYDLQTDTSDPINKKTILVAEPTQSMRVEQKKKYKDYAMQNLETVIIADVDHYPLYDVLLKESDNT